MAGILAHGFFDTVWYRPQVSTLWWLVLGLIASRCGVVKFEDDGASEQT
jgi:putative inorganic carbon (HCO3(-)) transporter